METDRLHACGNLTLLARLDINWPPPEELSHLVFMYKMAKQSEIPYISLIDVVTKMKLISWTLLNKTTKNSYIPLPES